LSDFHLGSPDPETSFVREKKIVAFLEGIRKDAGGVFILGDAFDFWYEYRQVVPKGYVRLLGKLAELTDEGIPIHFFVGNHDMWMKDYFQRELNIPVFFSPRNYMLYGKKFHLGHGDGLGPGDHGYKFLRAVFRNPVCQWLFGILPPVLGMGIAHYFSKRSRVVTGNTDASFLGADKEWLIQYCNSVLEKEHHDFFVFGHRHLPIDYTLRPGIRYLNLGDWIRYDTYAEFDGHQLILRSIDTQAASKIIVM
jgi:UDP-2,3-diacylglucosamine hydrolase